MERRLTEAESRLADLIWEREPLTSADLVGLCGERMNWKKSTTYTMLRRLEEKGIFKNEGGVVRSCATREGFYAEQSKAFVDKTFGGSLPRFLTAFTRSQKLTEEEIQELQKLIDEHREG